MSDSPLWMPFYISDYKKDTSHLSAAEHGAYLLLIMHYWQNGSLPKEDRHLSRIAAMTEKEWKGTKSTIAAFFDGEWRHKRIDRELAHAFDVISKRRQAALDRHNARRANAHANASQKQVQKTSKRTDAGVPQSPNTSLPAERGTRVKVRLVQDREHLDPEKLHNSTSDDDEEFSG